MENMETRTAPLTPADGEEGRMVLEGYAIVFGQETLIGDGKRGFREVILPGALEGADMTDVPLRYNHADSFLTMAGTKNGSLKLIPDEKGLRIVAELLDTQANRDVYKMVRSGLLDKMSFAFTVKAQEWDRGGEMPLRKIASIERLYDVSIVDLPAYEGTSVYSRSLELAERELKALDEEEDQRKWAAIVRRRIDLKLKTGGNGNES